jgi:hypothetical protein
MDSAEACCTQCKEKGRLQTFFDCGTGNSQHVFLAIIVLIAYYVCSLSTLQNPHAQFPQHITINNGGCHGKLISS